MLDILSEYHIKQVDSECCNEAAELSAVAVPYASYRYYGFVQCMCMFV